MARSFRHYDITVPASTPIATPQVTEIDFPTFVVPEIRVRIPPGPRGEVGFAIGSAGQPVVPYQSGQWIIADNQEVILPLDGFWDSGSWEFYAYNTGLFDHTLYVTFLLDLVAAALAPAPTIIPAAVLSAPAGVPLAPGSTGSPTGSNTTVAPLPPVSPPTVTGSGSGVVAPPPPLVPPTAAPVPTIPGPVISPPPAVG